MKTIDVTTETGRLIVSAIHDILCFTDGTDIVMISAVGSWGHTLSKKEVYEDLKSWCNHASLDLRRADIRKAMEAHANKDFKDLDQGIVNILVDIFDLLTPNSRAVQNVLKTWGNKPDKLILTQLDNYLKLLLLSEAKLLKDREIFSRRHMDTPKHYEELLHFYTDKLKARQKAIA